MRKLLLTFLGVALFPFCLQAETVFNDNASFHLAKAYKLGRGAAYSITGQNNMGGGGNTELSKDCGQSCASCNTSTGICSGCKSGYYLQGNTCISCPSNATCSGTDFTCNNYYYRSGDNCVNVCSGISCISGFTTSASANKCCCVSSGSNTTPTCYSGTYLSGSSCQTCSSGTYTSSSNATSCKSCSTIFLGSNVTCTSCSTTGTCTGSNVTSPSCSVGTYVSGSSCLTCPSGTYTSSSNATSCKSCSTLYVGSNLTCTSCSTTGTCTGSNGGSSSETCAAGYYKCTNSADLQFYKTCVPSDYGRSCTSYTQCTRGCANRSGAGYQGSVCW